MKYGSLFTGIGGFDAGFDRAGMQCTWQAERETACVEVLARHWPDIHRIDDVRRLLAWIEPRNRNRHATAIAIPDLICGGFPCQDVSVAGRRAGLAGSRSGLWFVFRRIVGLLRPRWVCIENVPGLLSSNGGRDMGTILGSLGKLGYGFAYRVLDAQWFGVPQRRRRVFIVGCLGDGRSAAEVLFERESLPWDSPPSREAGARVADPITRSFGKHGGASGGKDSYPRNAIVNCLDRHMGSGGVDDNAAQAGHVIAHTLRAEGHDASEDGTGRGTPIVPIDMRQASRGGTMTNNRREGSSGGAPGTGIGEEGDPSPTLADSHTPAVAYQCHGSNVGPMGTLRRGNGNEGGGVPFVMQERMESLNPNSGPNGKGWSDEGVSFTLESRTKPQSVATGMAVRRLTPTECERLQGFPDGWTEGLSDSARYRCLGNAVAVPVAEWIGKQLIRTQEVTP